MNQIITTLSDPSAQTLVIIFAAGIVVGNIVWAVAYMLVIFAVAIVTSICEAFKRVVTDIYNSTTWAIRKIAK